MTRKRRTVPSRSILISIVITASVSLFLGLWSAGWLDFDTIKMHHDQLAALVARYPLTSGLVFFIGFVIATGLSIPVATGLTLLAGSLFDFMTALLLVSFAATTGAALAMLLARYVLRDVVERKWPQLVARTNRGLERDGAFYLLALRLAPAPPYFVVNMLMGLTRMPVGRFFVVSQIGMLPLDVVFVNAGRALATLDEPSDVLSADIMMALLLASMIPLLLRHFLRMPSRRPKEEKPAQRPHH